jgi:hypothetical protein
MDAGEAAGLGVGEEKGPGREGPDQLQRQQGGIVAIVIERKAGERAHHTVMDQGRYGDMARGIFPYYLFLVAQHQFVKTEDGCPAPEKED